MIYREGLNVPMEFEWVTELGKFFHKEIVSGRKSISVSNWTDKGEIRRVNA